MRSTRWGRAWFALQAVAGAAWWIAVATVPLVRHATLGSLDPVLVAVFDVPLFVGASALAAGGLRPAAVVATVWTTLVAVALAVFATVTGEAGWGVLLMAGAVVGSALALAQLLLGRIPTHWVIWGPLGFRPAEARRGPARNLATTALEIVVFWGLFLAVIPLVVAFLERRWGLALPLSGPVDAATTVVGVVLLVVASAAGLWSGAVMTTLGDGTPLPSAMPNRLVVAGPYRVVRNPMAVASIAQGVAVGLLLSSWLVVAYAIAGALFWNVAVRPHEERDLEARFGDDFRRYRDAVLCWWPRLPVPAQR